MDLCRFKNRGGTSVKQLRCYLCSVCFMVMCIVFSSLFITSSFPVHQGRMHQLPVVPVVAKYKRTPITKDSIDIGFEVGTSATSARGTNLSTQSLEATGDVHTVALNSTTPKVPTVRSSDLRKEIPQSSTAQKAIEKNFSPVGETTGRVTSSEFRRVEKLCSQSVRKRTIHDDFPYLINEESLCSGVVYLLIAVHSKATYGLRRDLIRRTWGSVRQYNGHRIKVVFFIAAGGSPSTRKSIVEESRANRDIIQRDFVDHYRNITYKHLTVLRWVADHCHQASYFAKVDDDTFVNIFHTVHMLNMINPQNFMCKVVTGVPIRSARSVMSKWLVTRNEYPFRKYPLYCEGFAYLISANHARDLYWCSQFTKFFWIDDIFVSGILARKLKLGRERLWTGHSWAESIPSLASEKIMDYIFVRAGHNEIMPTLWMRLWKATLRYSY